MDNTQTHYRCPAKESYSGISNQNHPFLQSQGSDEVCHLCLCGKGAIFCYPCCGPYIPIHTHTYPYIHVTTYHPLYPRHVWNLCLADPRLLKSRLPPINGSKSYKTPQDSRLTELRHQSSAQICTVKPDQNHKTKLLVRCPVTFSKCSTN